MWKGSNYEVLEVISDNGSKVIYRCMDSVSGEKVIVKALRADFATYEEVMRFKREYRMLSDLSKSADGVVKPLKLEEMGGFFVIVLEDIDGQSLKRWMTDEKLDTETLLKLAIRIVEIVGSIHDNQVVHKDLKPSNIIWNRRTGQVQIIDFDLSVKLVKEKKEYQNTGLIEGTLPYISPEQTGRVNRNIDYSSDFYSLGVIFYEMFTGVKPHEADTIMEQIYSIIAKQPPSPYESTAGKVPRPLSDVIMKLLEKSPENRYRSVYGLKADLRKCLDNKAPFPIGEEDKRNVFQITQKLYGREKELQELMDAFQESIAGHSRMVLVSGEAGVGKTALVGELHRFISQERGYFIQGKFDQYNKHIPFSALIQAFRTLMAQWLKGEEADIAALRHSLASRLGDNGGLIAGLIPELQTLIASQTPMEPLNPTEESNRFFLSFVQFIEALTSNEKPLVLFLDDLQWADLSSIHMLERLVSSSIGLKKLLIIASFRLHEVSKGHPFALAVERMRQRNEVKPIVLQPLSCEEVCRMIQDTLGSGTVRVEELCSTVYNTTQGNPFYVNELLKDLYKHGAIFFDDREGAWRLDPGKVKDMSVSGDVLDFLFKKMNAFPAEVQRILSLSASIGRNFDWSTLLLVSEEEAEVVAASLIRAVDEEIIVPLHSNYPMLAAGVSEDDQDMLRSLELPFAFVHDKIQQALYQMIDPVTSKRRHLTIGRLLLEHLSPREEERKLVEIASHLNKGLEFVSSKDEIETIIDINLKSAKKVKESFGYDTALGFLGAAKDLLKTDAWASHYGRTFEIYKLYCECAYLTQQPDIADRACAVLLQHAKSRLEIAFIYEMQANHYTYLGMMKESIDAGKRGLKSLGVRIPQKVSMGSVIRELIRVKMSLRSRTAQELLDSPEMKDERIKLMMRLLVGFIPPAFISGEQNLFAWVVLRKTNLSARYGNGPESAGAYTGYAILLSGLGDLKGSHQFGTLAVQLNEKFNDMQWRSLVYVLYTLFSHSWNYSWDTLEGWYKRAIDSSLKSGDLLYLAHACYYMNLWHPSMEIERYLQESDRMISMIENTKYKEALATAKLARQKFRILSGELSDPASFDDDSFQEAAYLKELTDAKYYSGIAIYYLNKIQVLYMFEKYKEALPYIDQAYKYIGTLAGSAFMEEFSLYTYLNLAACYKDLSLTEKGKARIRMHKELGRMRKWAAHCPDNFLQHQYLMEAEGARIAGKHEMAEARYHLAVQTCGKGSFIRYKALANELAGKFYESRGLGEIAAYYFRQASYYYSVWGARGKVNVLERNYGEWIGGASRAAATMEKTLSVSTESIDIHSIIMASQALSKEIGLAQLLDTLMEIVIVNAGARRGCIVMKSNSTMMVEGEYRAEEDVIIVKQYDSHSLENSRFPRTMIEAAAETKETLIFQDAGSESSFVQDPYIAAHRPKSVLCMPLLNQNKVTAVIYLENNLVTGAFTKERIKTISLLSREMVYSLENASLYTDLERSEEKYRVLVSHVMDGIVIVQNGRFVFINEAMAQIIGYSVEEMTGEEVARYVHPDDLDMARDHHAKLHNGDEESVEYEIRLKHSDGQKEVMAIFKTTAIGYENNPAILGTVKNITERKKAEEELRTHRYKLEQLVAERTEQLELKNEQLNKYIDIVDKHVMIIQTDLQGTITAVSEEFCEISGYRKEEWIGRKHRFLEATNTPEAPFKNFSINGAAAGVAWKGELVQRTKDDKELWLDISIEPVFDREAVTGYTFIGHNITDKKRIEQLSITDELTGLYNRRYFNEIFAREVRRVNNTQDDLALILLDIDNYKKYNDTYGHYEGDNVLRRIGFTLRQALKDSAAIAFRLGGEEFGILYSGLDPDQSYAYAEAIRASIEALGIPHEKSEHSCVTVSVGLAVAAVKDHALNEETIYKLADDALYGSKAKGRNCVTMNVH